MPRKNIELVLPHEMALEQTPKAADERHGGRTLAPIHGRALVCAGGTGYLAGSTIWASEVEQGHSLPILGIDNASIPNAPIAMADGGQIPFPADRWLRLEDSADRLARLQGQPLVEHWLEESGLLRSVSAAHLSSKAGHGGHAHPLASLIDLQLHHQSIRAQLRKLLREAAWEGDDRRRGLKRALRREERGPVDVQVVAGGSGSCGSAAAQALGYLIREEAERLGLEQPRVWLLLAGPQAFRDLTPRWMVNWGMTVQTLRETMANGIELPLAGGVWLRSNEPAWDQIWLIDDPKRTESADEVSLVDFAQRVAMVGQLLLDPTVRDTYLDHYANIAPIEGWAGFGTVSVGAAGVSRTSLETLLANRLATVRSQALLEALGARTEAA